MALRTTLASELPTIGQAHDHSGQINFMVLAFGPVAFEVLEENVAKFHVEANTSKGMIQATATRLVKIPLRAL